MKTSLKSGENVSRTYSITTIELVTENSIPEQKIQTDEQENVIKIEDSNRETEKNYDLKNEQFRLGHFATSTLVARPCP